MLIKIILSTIFVPACVVLIFSMMQKNGIRKSKTMTDENFTVMIPVTVLIIGAMCSLMSILVLIGFTFFSNEHPHFIFYMTFVLFFVVGIYLILKTIIFKIVVQGEKITVFSVFKAPYTFTFSEIVSVVRQVKKSQTKSERLIIKTADNKKLTIESSDVSYKRFVRKIQLAVRDEYLIGFE